MEETKQNMGALEEVLAGNLTTQQLLELKMAIAATENRTGNSSTPKKSPGAIFDNASEEILVPSTEVTEDLAPLLWQPGRRDPPFYGFYWQIVVWPGVVVARDRINAFLSWVKTEFGLKYPVRPIGCVSTKNGRVDFLFIVHQMDVAHRFAPLRKPWGFKWLEEMVWSRYPSEFWQAYNKLW